MSCPAKVHKKTKIYHYDIGNEDFEVITKFCKKWGHIWPKGHALVDIFGAKIYES